MTLYALAAAAGPLGVQLLAAKSQYALPMPIAVTSSISQMAHSRIVKTRHGLVKVSNSLKCSILMTRQLHCTFIMMVQF